MFPSNPDFQKLCSLAKIFENGFWIGCSDVLMEHLMIIKQTSSVQFLKLINSKSSTWLISYQKKKDKPTESETKPKKQKNKQETHTQKKPKQSKHQLP